MVARSGLERYDEAFRDNAIDVEILPELTDADLEKLGVLFGHRKRLLKAIAELRPGETAPASLPGQPSRFLQKREGPPKRSGGS